MLIHKEFDWLIRTAMYAIAGCALIAKGGSVFIFVGVGLVFTAVFYSNLVLSVKLRDDILSKLGEKTAN
jgi:hypothetical protein